MRAAALQIGLTTVEVAGCQYPAIAYEASSCPAASRPKQCTLRARGKPRVGFSDLLSLFGFRLLEIRSANDVRSAKNDLGVARMRKARGKATQMRDCGARLHSGRHQHVRRR